MEELESKPGTLNPYAKQAPTNSFLNNKFYHTNTLLKAITIIKYRTFLCSKVNSEKIKAES